MQCTKEEQKLVLYWRQLTQGDVQISVNYRAGKPHVLYISYPDFVSQIRPYDYPLTQEEKEVLETGRKLNYGTLSLLVELRDNIPTPTVLADSFQTITLTQDSPLTQPQNKPTIKPIAKGSERIHLSNNELL